MAEKNRIAPSDNSFAGARDANQENASIKLFHEALSYGPADTKVAQQSSPSIQQMLNGFSISGADADPTAEAKKLDRDLATAIHNNVIGEPDSIALQKDLGELTASKPSADYVQKLNKALQEQGDVPNTNVVAPTVLTGELGAEIAADNPNSNISVFASVQNPVDVHGDVYAPSKDARPPQFETD